MLQATHRALLSAAALALTAIAAPAQQTSGAAPIPEQDAFDVRHYHLKLRVDPTSRRIDGSLAMQARAEPGTARIALDLDDGLQVTGVRVAGSAAEHEHRDGRIWIEVDPPVADDGELAVEVRYGGQPRVAPSPPWRGGFVWAKTDDGAPWIATACQGEGADLWWPCKDRPDDEPDGFDLEVTIPEGLVCASNGVLIADEPADAGWRRFHWRVVNPIANYSIALNIAPYELIETTYECVDGTQLPVAFYVLPKNRERAELALPEFLDHLRHMEETCGPYPFRNEKYGIVETPHLGMEHQTIIAYGNRYRRAGFDYDWLHHHEMCHEWWGNLVTNKSWNDMWIHEGIGTYMQALYIERKLGAKAYQTEMLNKRRGLANRMPVAPRARMDTQAIYFNGSGNDIYNKGSWVCHTLRWLLGDERFFEVLRRWAYPDPKMESVTDGSQCRFADTDELIAIAEAVAEQPLAWYFEVSLRRAPLPRLLQEAADGVLELRWETPDDLPYPMPVPVQVGDEIRRVEMTDDRASVPVGEAAWVVDPDHWLLREAPRRGRQR